MSGGSGRVDEATRVAVLRAYAILDTPPEPAFDRLAQLAAQLFDAPIALITLVDRDRQWFKARRGVDLAETPRELSFCSHTIALGSPMVVEDALADARFVDNPLVRGGPRVRFYAGAPLIDAAGVELGALAVLDREPRRFSPAQVQLLNQLATNAMGEIALRAMLRSESRTTGIELERAAFEAGARLSFLTEQLPAILWTTDSDLRFSSAVGAGLAAIGLRPNQVVGSSAVDFFSAFPDGARHVAAHRAALGGRGAATVVRFEGRAYQTRIDPLREPSGAIVGVIGVALDITDRIRSEEAVRGSEERYRLIARISNDVVREWSVDTGEVVWSEGVESVFRHPRAEVVATNDWWERHVHVDDRARVVAKLTAALAPGGTPWQEEYRFARGDGSYASVFDRGYVLRDAQGKAAVVFGSMVDVTERRLMEAKLRQAERLASVGTLAAGLAHEINNPLTYVLANIGFVSEGLARWARAAGAEVAAAGDVVEPFPKRLEDLAVALAEAQEGALRVRQIVRDLKIFSRGDDEQRGAVDISRLIESCIGMVTNEIRHRARLVKRLGPVPLVEANESRLRQVFLNLLINAAQSIREGDSTANEICVTTETDAAGRAVLTVADTGDGIPPDIVKRIFDPFFTTKPVGVGTGLGLFICHGIVRGMGGEITVDSAPGRGATFRVALPVQGAEARPVEPRPKLPGAVAARRLRLLLVDDEPGITESVRRALDGEHDIACAGNGREALAILLDSPRAPGAGAFDVILCDLMMPDVSGVELYERLERDRPDLTVRVVFMTGGAFTAGAAAFLDRVPNRRFDKPFDLDRLRAVLAEVPAAE